MRLLPIGLDEIDETVCGAIVRGDLIAMVQLRFNGLGQLLSQLHAPLIERVNVPNNALHEDLVLVEC